MEFKWLIDNTHGVVSLIFTTIAIVMMFRTYRGIRHKANYTAIDKRISFFFMVFLYIQCFLGFLLFFVFLQAITFFIIGNSSGYQKTSILNSANSVSGWFYKKEKKIQNYFSLQEINEKLNEDNALLKEKAIRNYQIISENTIKIEGKNYQLQYDYQH